MEFNKLQAVGWISNISAIKESKTGLKYRNFEFIFFEPSKNSSSKWPAPIKACLFEENDTNLLLLKENQLVSLIGKINSIFYKRKCEISIIVKEIKNIDIENQ